MNDAKESATMVTRASNVDILMQLNKLTEAVNSIKGDIEEIKRRAGFRDRPVGMPDTKNYNTDPGPWVKKNTSGVAK